VLYVENDEEWKDGLNVFLSGYEDIEWISYTPTAGHSSPILYQHPLHVIVVDTMLEGYNPSELQAAFNSHILNSKVKIIMFTSLDQGNDIFNEAFLHGAYEYVRKSDFDLLPNMIREAVNHSNKFGVQLMELVHERRKLLMNEDDSRLLKLILERKSQQQIARELSLSTAAIVKQINRIYQTFNWKKSSEELVDRCVKWGIFDK